MPRLGLFCRDPSRQLVCRAVHSCTNLSATACLRAGSREAYPLSKSWAVWMARSSPSHGRLFCRVKSCAFYGQHHSELSWWGLKTTTAETANHSPKNSTHTHTYIRLCLRLRLCLWVGLAFLTKSLYTAPLSREEAAIGTPSVLWIVFQRCASSQFAFWNILACLNRALSWIYLRWKRQWAARGVHAWPITFKDVIWRTSNPAGGCYKSCSRRKARNNLFCACLRWNRRIIVQGAPPGVQLLVVT